MMRENRLAVAVVLVAASLASAQSNWTVMTTDFSSSAANVASIDEAGVGIATGGGETQVRPWSSIVRLGRGAAAAAPSGLVLCTARGERIVGTPSRIDGNNLVWKADLGAELSVPMESVLGILRDRTQADTLSQPRTEDQAVLQTGDSVKGILTDAAPDAFTLTPATGDPVKVPVAPLASFLFAAPPGGRPAVKPPAFLVRVGPSVIGAESVAIDRDRLAIKISDASTIKVAVADVVAIEHTGGPVAWLSSRLPAESTQTPYLDGDRPARMDQAVAGGPIRFGGVTYDRGIGVHSRSKLVFNLEPGDKSFRTRYAIDGPLTRADVDVRVLVDGKIIHEKTGFKAGTLSPVVEADLTGAKTLTLEVDYGRGFDVQDRLNWIEPAIIRAEK
ncbi:MAG: NPCBM/NEW2 domain-containing protein [Tepidisphaeraceae bacterium]